MISTRTRIVNAVALLASLTLVALLLIPPPQQSRAQFFAQQGWAGTSGGSANAQTLVVPNMDVLVRGVPITFIPVATNTGPATINVNSIGAVVVKRPSSVGLTGLSGSELTIGVLTTIMYDGSNLDIVSPVNPAPVGSVIELRGAAAPPGYLIEDGSCVSQTTYAALFSVIATGYGSCSAGLFAVPDSRGTVFAALDNQGSNGAASRITSAGSGCNANTVTYCGGQNQTLTLSQLPTGITVTGTVTVFPNGNGTNNFPFTNGSISGVSYTAGSSTNLPTTTAAWAGTPNASGVNTLTSNNTLGTAHPILPPILIGTRAIKF